MTAASPAEPVSSDDPREAALEAAHEWADLLCGDVVLLPFVDGVADWDHMTRQSLVHVGGDWRELDPSDLSRLGVLTDGFDKFIRNAGGVSIVTLLNGGAPTLQQIDGPPLEAAIELLTDAIIDRERPRELRREYQADPLEIEIERLAAEHGLAPGHRPAWLMRAAQRNIEGAANDNSDAHGEQKRTEPQGSEAEAIARRLERLRKEHGGEIRGRTLYGATVEGKKGLIVIHAGTAFLHTSEGECFALTESTPIKATSFSLRDPAAIPEREWLHARHYIRRYLTETVGAGGGGKSAHAVSEVLAMVTGRPLLDPDGALTKPLRTWYINAEDPAEEIERRFTGAAKHFRVTAEQMGDRLFTDSGRDQEFVIMRQSGREFAVCEPLIDEMIAEICANQIDVVIVDPFVSTHEVPENDNGLIQRVAKAWLRVAEGGNCAVEVIHHIVKGTNEVTADSSRGGGALKDKARSVRTLNPMTPAEATKAGVDDPLGYFRVDFGKANMAPRSAMSRWRRFASVPLGNGRGLLKTGDEIGVVEPWSWPNADSRAEKRSGVVADVPPEVLAGLKVRLENGDYKASDQARAWAGDVVAELLGIDVKEKSERARVRDMLAAWVDMGELQIVDILDHRRHFSPHIKPCAA